MNQLKSKGRCGLCGCTGKSKLHRIYSIGLLIIILAGYSQIASAPVTDFIKKDWYPENKTVRYYDAQNDKTWATLEIENIRSELTRQIKDYNLTSYMNYKIPKAEKPKTRFSILKGTAGISGEEWFIRTTVSDMVPDYGINSTNKSRAILIYNNETGVNETTTEWYWDNQSVVIGNHTEIRYEYVPFSLDDDISLVKGESYHLRQILYTKAQVGERRIHTNLTLFGQTEENATWWNASKLQARHSTITNPNITVINISLSNLTGTTTNTSFFSNRLFNKNFTGINFTKNNATEIPFWLEFNYTNDQNNATAWINISTILNTTDSVDMYYNEGNLGTQVGSASNGTNTFPFFGDTLNKWTVTGSVVLSGDEFTITGGGSWGTNGLLTKNTFARPIIIEGDIKSSNTLIDSIPLAYSIDLVRTGDVGIYRSYSVGAEAFYYGGYYGTASFDLNYESDKLVVLPTQSYDAYRNNIQFDTYTGAAMESNMYISSQIYTNSQTLTVKNIRARKHASPEPTWTGWVGNVAPVVVNITLSPSSPAVTDNLTTSLNATDADGDSLTKHYVWYKNSSLQTAWNDSTYVNYTNNFTVGDIIYVSGFVFDGYENSSILQSNSVVIGSGNSAPILSGITLTPSTKKYSKTITVSTSTNITDTESSSVQLQVYRYVNGSKSYFSNSSWLTPPNNASVTITIPWSDGLAHTIYAQAEDSGNITGKNNLSSGEASAIFTSNTTSPTVNSSIVSPSSVATGSDVTITITADGKGANISSANGTITRPDLTVVTVALTCTYTSGDISTCTRTYTANSGAGAYTINSFGLLDDSGISATPASNLTFQATAASSGSSSGGGGNGGGTTTIIKENVTTATLLLGLKNLTSGATQPELEEISRCLTDSLFMQNKCSGYNYGVVVEPMNWWVFTGALFASFGVVVGRGIHQDKQRDWLTEPLLYATTTTLILVVLVAVGFNMYLLNYLAGSPKYAWTFASTALWGGLVALIWDEYYYGKKTFEILRNV